MPNGEFWVRSFPYPLRYVAGFWWLCHVQMALPVCAWQFSLALLRTFPGCSQDLSLVLGFLLFVVFCLGLGFSVLMGVLWSAGLCKLVLCSSYELHQSSSHAFASDSHPSPVNSTPPLSSLLRISPSTWVSFDVCNLLTAWVLMLNALPSSLFGSLPTLLPGKACTSVFFTHHAVFSSFQLTSVVLFYCCSNCCFSWDGVSLCVCVLLSGGIIGMCHHMQFPFDSYLYFLQFLQRNFCLSSVVFLTS